MLQLFLHMIERLGMIILIAYLLVQTRLFKHILAKRDQWSVKVQLILIFSVFALLSNLNGVEVSSGEIVVGNLLTSLSPGSSLANTRALTIGISGLIGGPVVGVSVGLISSLFRFIQGGLDPIMYVISSVLIGGVSGGIGYVLAKEGKLPSVAMGSLLGALFESIQMVIILAFSHNFWDAWELVQFIFWPMMLINSLGMAIFLSFIQSTRMKEVQDRAVQTHDVLRLANATLPYFRQGLKTKPCMQAAQEILNYIQVSAVSITDTKEVIAHVGAGSDHHKPGRQILTEMSTGVLETRQVKIARDQEEIGCPHHHCPLEAAIVVPLMTRKGIVGTLKLYFTDAQDLTYIEKNLAEGLGNIFSTQIELGNSETEARLLQDAEIKSLQAQINPHFLFNAMNTISAMIRIDSEKARELLLKLSGYFRANIAGARSNLISLDQELSHVNAYTTLETTRFPDRYTINITVGSGLDDLLVPPFIIQVLVENAFKHAFAERKTENIIDISVQAADDQATIRVQDNGIGINSEKLDQVGKEAVYSDSGTGSALMNLNKRLVHLFGKEARLRFSVEQGTTIYCHIPMKKRGD